MSTMVVKPSGVGCGYSEYLKVIKMTMNESTEWEELLADKRVGIVTPEKYPTLRHLSPVTKAFIIGENIIEVYAKDSDKNGTAVFSKHYVDVMKAKFPNAKWMLANPSYKSGSRLRLLVTRLDDDTFAVLAPRKKEESK